MEKASSDRVATPAPSATARTRPARSEGEMPRAPLVDDDVNFVLGLAEVVGRECFTTKAAHTLKEAKAEIARGVPDVVLVDLPARRTGSTCSELEGSLGPGSCSSPDGPRWTPRSNDASGASDFIVKPVDPSAPG